MTIFLIVITFVVLLLITLAISYNGFVKLRNQSDEAFSTMDIFKKNAMT